MKLAKILIPNIIGASAILQDQRTIKGGLNIFLRIYFCICYTNPIGFTLNISITAVNA